MKSIKKKNKENLSIRNKSDSGASKLMLKNSLKEG
jgi:hypothetical protein